MKTKKELKNNEKILLLGYPSNGLVGTFTISYLVHHLKMQQIGEIDHPDLAPALFIEDGEIMAPIRAYKKDNLYVIISDLPFDPFQAHDFTQSAIAFCKKQGISKTIIVSGMETINRASKTSKIYGLATDQAFEKILYAHRIPKFLAGSIFGIDAAVLSVFRKLNFPALLLYAECHSFFPDPEASIAAITLIAKILKIKIDTFDLQKKMEQLRIQHRNLMEETLKTFQQQETLPASKIPHIYR